MEKRTLGLDLGTNSIGWAVLAQDATTDEPASIIATGVRIFQEAVEAKTRTPKNQLRRAARSARRILFRRKMRQKYLLTLLQSNQMIPTEANEVEAWKSLQDPYVLRKKGLDEPLTLLEFGRALYHLCQRRGYWSNRISDRNEKGKKEQGVVLEGIKTLKDEMAAFGARTLGEFLSAMPSMRRRFTERGMYFHEFSELWVAQSGFHPDILTDELRLKILRAIFFQRPLRLQKRFIGNCTFEPTRLRAPKASPLAQRFRIFQDVNNLEVRDPITRKMNKLSPSDQQKLFEVLQKQKNLTWDKARKLLGLHSGEVFNLEKGKKSDIPGNRTAYAFKAILGNGWDDLDSWRQEALAGLIISISDPALLLKKLKEDFSFSEAIAQELAEMELEPNYTRLSRTAMRKIIPFLEKGVIYSDACSAAGYVHSQPQEVTRSVTRLPAPTDLRNPVVQKALWETRRLINAIVSKYGFPTTIRLEMARDMKESKAERDETNKRNREREQNNKRISSLLTDNLGIEHPSRNDRIKYQLWEECRGLCPYSGVSISERMLFNGEVDVEHILPYSLSLDDSMMNKTLCLARENREVKRNQSPFQAYGANTEGFQELLKRVDNSRMHPSKKRKFEQQEIDTDDFVKRQLNDTRYISVEVKDYLQQLGVPVEVSKGSATFDLRKLWQLDEILAPAGEGEKNRADHRHHALDAVVIALTTRSLFMKLSRLSSSNVMGLSPSERGFSLPMPWDGFKKSVRESLAAITVSHSVNRKITGALHEETAYGKAGTAIRPGYLEMTFRKRLATFDKPKQLESVRDEGVRRLMAARLSECDGDFKRAFGNPDRPLLHKDGKTPILSARITTSMKESGLLGVKDKAGKPYKYFSLGSNHHVEIIENVKTGKRDWKIVTTLEAARRARRTNNTEQIIKTDHGPEWKFITGLHINDLVEIEVDGLKRIYRMQKMSAPFINLRLHTAATLDNKDEEIQKSPSTFIFRELKVDPLGQVTYLDQKDD